jgi:hypothetical protein
VACVRLSCTCFPLAIFVEEVVIRPMPPRASRTVAHFLLRAILCLFCLWQSPPALSAQADLHATREKLAGLEGCLGLGNTAINRLRQGLLSGYSQGRPWAQRPTLLDQMVAPPPAEYLDSLDRDLMACDVAKRQKDDKVRKAILDQVLQDVTIKAQDCERFGMGRLVQVNVSTVRAGMPENGWVVFWKWMPVGPLQTVETSLPGLTSPATKAFPPGTYAFRAEKRISSTEIRTTETRTVIVGGTATVDCPLLIE